FEVPILDNELGGDIGIRQLTLVPAEPRLLFDLALAVDAGPLRNQGNERQEIRPAGRYPLLPVFRRAGREGARIILMENTGIALGLGQKIAKLSIFVEKDAF